MVHLKGRLRPVLDFLADKAWRGARADQAGQFLVQPSGLVPGKSPESLHESLAALYRHAKRWAPGLEVPSFVPPVRIEVLDSAGKFRVDEENDASIAISTEHVGDDEAILLILSHEACHDILRQSQLNHRDDVELDELTTDLAMFICGFGELVLRGHSRIGHGGGGRLQKRTRSRKPRSRVHLGYLNAVEYQEAFDHVLSLRAANGLPGRFNLTELVVNEPAQPLSPKEEGGNGKIELNCGEAMCKRSFRAPLRREGKPWPVKCPACGVFLYPVDVLEHAAPSEFEPKLAELRLWSDGHLVECTSATLSELADPIEARAPAPLDPAALLAAILEDAPPVKDPRVPLQDPEPPVPSQSSAPRLPWQRRAVLAPLKRPEPPSRAAKMGMSEESEWIQLDEKMARRQGLPALIPVPKSELEGIAEEGFSVDLCRQWANDFLLNSEAGKSGVWRKKNGAIVSSLEAFVDKGPLWEKAQTAFAENDYNRAITRLKRIVSMDPDDHAARLDLASALAITGDYPGALKAFKAIRKTFEGDPDYHVDLGQVHLALDDRESALNEMTHALEARPDCQAALDAMAQMGILAVAEYLSGRRAEAVAKAEEKARAIAAAKAEEVARAIAAAKAEGKVRLDALAKIQTAMTHTDASPRSPDGIDPPKVVPGMLNMARLPDLNGRQRQQIMERGKKTLAEEREKARTAGSIQEKAPTRATEIEALLALVDLEPEGPTREKVLTGAVFDEALGKTKEDAARMQEKALAEAVAKAEKARAEAAVEAEKAARTQEKALAEAAAKEKACAEVAAKAEKARAEAAAEAEKATRIQEGSRAEAVAEAAERARDEVAARTKEIARDDTLAKTKENVARVKETTVHETAAKAKEKARRVRHALLLVAALIIAVALAILGKRTLAY
jgi:tetratricopeptide (TPR) repeat protein